jgi:hypothetical protein
MLQTSTILVTIFFYFTKAHFIRSGKSFFFDHAVNVDDVHVDEYRAVNVDDDDAVNVDDFGHKNFVLTKADFMRIGNFFLQHCRR